MLTEWITRAGAVALGVTAVVLYMMECRERTLRIQHQARALYWEAFATNAAKQHGDGTPSAADCALACAKLERELRAKEDRGEVVS